MNSFNKREGKNDRDNEKHIFVRYATIKTREELDQYYSRNKSKLPPILQSRSVFRQHMNLIKTDRIQQLTHETDYNPTERVRFKTEQPCQLQINKSSQLIPRLGKLILDKNNPRKFKRQYLISYSSVDRKMRLSLSKKDEVRKQPKTLLTRQKLRTQNISKKEEDQLIKLMKRIQSTRIIPEQSTSKALNRKMITMPQQCRQNIKSLYSNRTNLLSNQVKTQHIVEETQKIEQIKNKKNIKINTKSTLSKQEKQTFTKLYDQLSPWEQQTRNFQFTHAFLK